MMESCDPAQYSILRQYAHAAACRPLVRVIVIAYLLTDLVSVCKRGDIR